MPKQQYTLWVEDTFLLPDEAVALLDAARKYEATVYSGPVVEELLADVRAAIARELGDRAPQFFNLLDGGAKLEKGPRTEAIMYDPFADSVFTPYMGEMSLEETTIDDIPLHEQRAYYAMRDWPSRDDALVRERDSLMQADWFTFQRVLAGKRGRT